MSGNHTKGTLSVHAGKQTDPRYPGVNTPIHTSTAYHYPNRLNEIWYPRYFNTAGQVSVAQKLAALEGGEAALILSSGMAAISTTLLAFCRQNDHILVQESIYGGTFNFVKNYLPAFGIQVDFFLDENDLEGRIQPHTKLIYIESPSNPLMNIVDLSEVARIAKIHRLLTVIDNTFATPINQNPIDFGFDIVIHSGTKYLGGHSDLCCGAVISTGSLIKKIMGLAKCLGGELDALACYQLERSLKTLALRVKQQNENALGVAEFLVKHPKVKKVFYPGLPNHSRYALAKDQMRGFGGMLSFELDGIEPDQFIRRLRLITPAVSLGGVESLVCIPVQTSHASLSELEKQKIGLSDSLLRLSVGIEDREDLLADLDQAF